MNKALTPNLRLFFVFTELPVESPVKSSPVKQASILRYMSPQKSTAQSEAGVKSGTQENREDAAPQATPHHHLGDRDAVRQSERFTTSDDVTGDMPTAEADDDISDDMCTVAKDNDNVVGADWDTNMQMDWDGDDVDDADLLNQNEAEEEDEPWLCAKKRKLWRKGTSFVK